MLDNRALLGKNNAKSVANMQCFMFPKTCLYSSGFSFANILWCSYKKRQIVISEFLDLGSLLFPDIFRVIRRFFLTSQRVLRDLNSYLVGMMMRRISVSSIRLKHGEIVFIKLHSHIKACQFEQMYLNSNFDNFGKFWQFCQFQQF